MRKEQTVQSLLTVILLFFLNKKSTAKVDKCGMLYKLTVKKIKQGDIIARLL